ncbi:MAG: hypothetical protein WBX25_31605 [Rhodomicrobium sp.]
MRDYQSASRPPPSQAAVDRKYLLRRDERGLCLIEREGGELGSSAGLPSKPIMGGGALPPYFMQPVCCCG